MSANTRLPGTREPNTLKFPVVVIVVAAAAASVSDTGVTSPYND